MESDLFQQFENGILVDAGRKTDLSRCAWNKHKDFAGVSLKNVVTADQTAGLFTCHLVRIDPHCAIGLHAHPASIELHEVVQGSGVCLIAGEEIPYVPGTMALLARNAPHEVRAGAEGLRLFAKFVTVQA
jgi:quercetin dioxygenase-like cupin family protein